MALAAVKQGNSFADALQKTSKTTKSKSKTKATMPTLDVPKHIKEEVDKYVEAKQTEKIAKAEKESAGKIILDHVGPHQDKEGYNGLFRHSYAVPGTNGNQVKYVSSNRFTINADDSEQLQEILGSDFHDLIEQNFTVTLKPEVFQDQDLQDELMGIIGDRFGDFFETKESLAVAEDFDRRIYKTVTEKDLPTLRTFCRQYKASLR